ncbi:hypothetical protein [Altererythrobacter sp. GH1-8]|uniref:hypothetical protein n=1 Tax=Altererythrobacter sp. GH1-8 TaxID=3349333 RepID=UPI00374D954C
MLEEPQERVSEITEISDRRGLSGLGNFIAAWIWGTLAGTASLVAGFAFMEGGVTSMMDLVGGIVAFGIFVGIYAAAGMVLIGLPITALLRAIEMEAAWLYSGFGAFAGLLILWVLFGNSSTDVSEILLFVLPGMLAGLASAYRWGRWREGIAKARQTERENLEAQKRTNPIHDLIH